MIYNAKNDSHGQSFCTLSYNSHEAWLEATWYGHVDPLEAQQGAQMYLAHAAEMPSPLLLNDNSQLRGPWFESLDWLADVWVPQAEQLGLRYVAHIVQADVHHDVLTARLEHQPPFELQIFQDANDARDWLRDMRQAHGVQVPAQVGQGRHAAG